ncbi:MAG: hypothetical protein Q7T53_05255 [Deltaproteobacteria bacterium]|nr:hypothetical protein [Deltaproteobacteria bacterium]
MIKTRVKIKRAIRAQRVLVGKARKVMPKTTEKGTNNICAEYLKKKSLREVMFL